MALIDEEPTRPMPPLLAAPPGGAPRRAGDAGLPVELSDADARLEQGRLYDLCFGKDDGTRVLPWRYDESPHGCVVAPIARDASGAIVASYACSPRRVHFRGEAVGAAVVGQTGDVMTHPGLRSKGIFSDLHWNAMERAQRLGWAAAWGLPNKHSGYIFFGKLGWKLAGHIGPWNLVLVADDRARSVRLQNGRVAAWGTPWAAWSGARRRARLRAAAQGLAAAPLEHFEDEVLDLAAEVEPRFDWMVHRSAEYLNWRFLSAPSGLFRALGVRDRSGALVAYAVLQVPRPGQPIGFVADLVGVDRAAEGAALDAAVGALARAGAAVVRAYGMRGSSWERVLERGGFRRPRGYKEVGAYAIDRDHPLAASTLDTSSWYFTDGDRDDETAR